MKDQVSPLCKKLHQFPKMFLSIKLGRTSQHLQKYKISTKDSLNVEKSLCAGDRSDSQCCMLWPLGPRGHCIKNRHDSEVTARAQESISEHSCPQKQVKAVSCKELDAVYLGQSSFKISRGNVENCSEVRHTHVSFFLENMDVKSSGLKRKGFKVKCVSK